MKSSLEEQNLALIKENSKLKEQIEIKNRELDKLEHVLLANLAHKEQEIADLSAQIEDMKSSMNPCNQQLRCMGLDPAVNVVFIRIKKEMKAVMEKLEQTQNDLQAWKFTPDSQTGKRMMTRMRVLLQENEELGKMNQSGRTAKLESEIAMKKTLIEELKQTNSEYENVIEEMDTETEFFQTSICMLQQQLSIAKATINNLYDELNKLNPGKGDEIFQIHNWSNNQDMKSEPMELGDSDINGTSKVIEVDSDYNFIKSESIDELRTNIINDGGDVGGGSSGADKMSISMTNCDSLTTDNDLCVAKDDNNSDNTKIVNKKHSIKSHSTFNSKKLTSS